MALPTAPPMIRPSDSAVSRPCERASQSQSSSHGQRLEAEQDPLADRPLRLEQAVADAGVAGEHEIEERAEPQRMVGEIDHEQQIKLAGLIEHARDSRDREAETRKRAS